MKSELWKSFDFEKVNDLLEGFNKTTGFVTALLDLEGNVLSKSGWRQICTEFHRVNKETAAKCRVSDTVLAGKMGKDEKYHFYECLNGLVDVAVPVIIDDEHIANLFSGQFFFEKPNKEYFSKQAEKYGFEKIAYLDNLDKVPVLSKEKVITAMEFLHSMVELIIDMTQQKINLSKLNDSISENEEKYRLLHEAAGVGIGYYTPEGVVISYNTIAAQNMNGKPEDFRGKSIFDLFPEEAANEYFARIQNALQSEIPQNYEDKVVLPDSEVWFSSVYSRILNSNHKITGVQIISTDITDRKLAEEKEKILLERLNRTAANVPGAIFEFCLRPDGTSYVPYASQGFEKIYGISPEEVKTDASSLFALNQPEDMDRIISSIKESAETLTPWQLENKIVQPSGKSLWIEGRSQPQKLDDGTIIWHGYVSDITGRKRAEEERQKFVMLANSSSEFIGMCDLDLNPLYVNPAGIKMVGLPNMEAACSIKVEDYFYPEDQAFIRDEFFPKVLHDGHGEVEIRLRHFLTGQPIWMSYYLFHLRNTEEKLIGWATVSRDITERKKAEIQLKESEQRFLKIFNNSPIGVNLVSISDNISLDINDAYLKIIGYSKEEVVGKTAEELNLFVDFELRSKWIKELKETGRLKNQMAQFRAKSGEIKDIMASIEIIELEGKKVSLIAAVDVTDKIRAEEELKKLNENLEKLVEERTHELNQKMAKIEKMNNLFVGRELRMKELKNRIKDLEEQIK